MRHTADRERPRVVAQLAAIATVFVGLGVLEHAIAAPDETGILDQAADPANATLVGDMVGSSNKPTSRGEAAADWPAMTTAGMVRGAHFLLNAQRKDGSWGSPRRTKGLNVYAPVPGAHRSFHAAVTALAVKALVELNRRELGEDAAALRRDGRAAVERGVEWLEENLPRLRRGTPAAIYNVWAHAYAVDALSTLAQSNFGPETRSTALELLRGQIAFLSRFENLSGGWGYYDFHYGMQKPAGAATSFTTATALIALKNADAAGIKPPRQLTRRAVASLQRLKKPDFSYLYSAYWTWRPMHPINRPGGSLGRSQACNLALHLWDDESVTSDVMRSWLDRLLARSVWLDIGRKRPIPHEAWFQVAGYFYYYGYYYAALSLEQLPIGERRIYQQRVASTLLKRQETDGSWWDFPFYDYHQPYGTSFALMALERCLPPRSLDDPKPGASREAATDHVEAPTLPPHSE